MDQRSSTGLGTARVGSERAPSYHDLDAALSKAFNITESKHLDFRADFFNVLNTTSLAPPTNNVSGGIGLINQPSQPSARSSSHSS